MLSTLPGFSVATFGHRLTEGLQLNNGARNYFCLDRFSFLLPTCGSDAAGQRKSVRSGFLQSPSVTLGIEIIYSNVRNGGRGGIEKQFLVEAMLLRSHKARELGAYLLSRAVTRIPP